MAVSSDESEVYIAILESGNGSTIIAAAHYKASIATHSRRERPAGRSARAGENPFPNFGDIFDPNHQSEHPFHESPAAREPDCAQTKWPLARR